MLEVNDAEALGRLRTLPAYQRALHRHQFDAEACLSRVMIRTGRTLEQLRGDDLLHYADVVKTSGRTRREHLAWELMVALGPFAAEPSTLRAAWSAKGTTRQHSVATLVDRYGIGAGGVRDLLVDYITEIKPSMDYGTLEGWVYRLVRLFWWEVLQINPHQTDLRLDTATTTAWRERLAVTTDGQQRREIHSILFAVRAMYRDLAEWSHEEPGSLGPMGGALSGPSARVDQSVQGEAAAEGADAGPDEDADTAPAGSGRRGDSPEVVDQRAA